MAGRAATCPCGSGRRSRRCCGAGREASEAELARAHLDGLVIPAVCMLVSCSKDELAGLYEQAQALTSVHPSLHVQFPLPVTPEVTCLLQAVAAGSGIDEALPAAVHRLDTPLSRARLAQEVAALRDTGAIEARVGAVALLELATPKLKGLLGSAVLRGAVMVAVGDPAPEPALRATG